MEVECLSKICYDTKFQVPALSVASTSEVLTAEI
jgi:hypothetical protein